MEKKQNIQERIDEIYNGNSKIPFMQSKEILTLGYEYGVNDSNKKIINTVCETISNNVPENKNDIKPPKLEMGGKTSKEMIEYANKKIKEDKKELTKKDKHELDVKILKAQVQLSGEIINYMNIKRDFLDVYEYIKDLNRKFQNSLYKEQLNHGEYKRR